jgi:hypothetical protein
MDCEEGTLYAPPQKKNIKTEEDKSSKNYQELAY